MEELTVEQKAAIYDEAIKKAKIEKEKSRNLGLLEFIDEIFPELSESDDERIKKEIISIINAWDTSCRLEGKYCVVVPECITWLENQVLIDREKVLTGARKDIALSIMDFLDKTTISRCLSSMECKDLEDAVVNSNWSKVYNYMKKKLEKQPIMNVPSREVILAIWELGNIWKELTHGVCSTEYGTTLDYIQKHWHESEYYLKKQCEENLADKVKSKFKVGDWIVYKDTVWKICNVGLRVYYELLSINNEVIIRHIEGVDKTAHIWTIQDAKDGDVLANDISIFIYAEVSYNKPYAYCGVDKFGIFKDNCRKYNWSNSVDDIHPATKEQRDALKKAMADAGWEFDFEKKELKKIESYSLRSIIKDEPSPAIKKVVDSLTAQNKDDDKIKQAHNVETQKSVEWEPQTGDTFRKKGTTSPTYHLCGKREDGITFGFVENREVGIAGGEITIFALKSDYELVERPKPIEDVVEEELNKALQTKVEQKPAWSEEDENMLKLVIKSCEQCGNEYAYYWLKSFKDRVQPKQESLKSITANCDYSEYEDWT